MHPFCCFRKYVRVGPNVDSTNQPTNQPTAQPTNQPLNHSTNPNQPTNQPTNPTNQLNYRVTFWEG